MLSFALRSNSQKNFMVVTGNKRESLEKGLSPYFNVKKTTKMDVECGPDTDCLWYQGPIEDPESLSSFARKYSGRDRLLTSYGSREHPFLVVSADRVPDFDRISQSRMILVPN